MQPRVVIKNFIYACIFLCSYICILYIHIHIRIRIHTCSYASFHQVYVCVSKIMWVCIHSYTHAYIQVRLLASRVSFLGLCLGIMAGSILLVGVNMIPKLLSSDPAVQIWSSQQLPCLSLILPFVALAGMFIYCMCIHVCDRYTSVCGVGWCVHLCVYIHIRLSRNKSLILLLMVMAGMFIYVCLYTNAWSSQQLCYMSLGYSSTCVCTNMVGPHNNFVTCLRFFC
jgi:hypothetical protein